MKVNDYFNNQLFKLHTEYHLKKINPETRKKAKEIISICQEKKVELYIYEGLLRLHIHAKYYRQSRSWSVIKRKIQDLRNRGFGYLADIIEEVGPQNGVFASFEAPGESWLNYAEGFCATPIVKYKALTNFERGEYFWQTYGKAVKKVGMYWGGQYRGAKDYSLAQLREKSNPLKVLTPDQVYYTLKKYKQLK